MRYEEYKETGYRFCPSLPASWNTKSGRFCFEENKKKNTDLAEKTLLQFTYGSIVRKKNQEITKDDESIIAKYTVVQPFDIMVNGLNLNYDFVSQRIGLVCEPGVITSAYLALRCHDVYNPYYANYMLKALDAQKVFHGMGSGVRLTLGYPEFSKIKFPVPPREEQDQIVRYLDWKVSCINKLIHGYQRQIKLLEERYTSMVTAAVVQGINENAHLIDANIQGFDRIPDTWKIVQNKRIFRERSDVSKTGNETLLSVSKRFGVKPYNKLEESEKLATIKPADSLVGYKKVAVGNLAMNIMRARNGSYGISDYEGIVSPAYCVYELVMPADSRYMHYLLKTPQVISLFEAYSYGICEHRRRLYAPDFLRLYLPIPPVEEQKEIADYVAVKGKKKHSLVKQLEKQITLLKEYRTRLISDVVTGQMDVRGVTVPEYVPETDEEVDETLSDAGEESEV